MIVDTRELTYYIKLNGDAMTPRTGRPKLAPSERRNVVLQLVVTKAEAVRIRMKSKLLGLSISDYLRSVAIPKE